MKELGHPLCHILTWNEENVISTDSGEIHVLPVWKWLLGTTATN
ncbi:MAG: hypothetical protein WCJ26_07770 [bacterium]